METDVSQIIKKVNAKEQDFNSLYTCMDEDFDLRTLNTTPLRTNYELTTRAKTGSHTTDVEVFSNRPCTFADAVQAVLLASERQISVRMAEEEGEDKQDDMAKLERLLEFILCKADERLRRLLLPPLKLSLIELSTARGGAAGRFLIYKTKEGKIFPDFIPWDPRWLTYEVGPKGLAWVAYKTFRPKSALEGEYGKEIAKKPWYKPWQKEEKNVEVIDYWEDDGKGISNSVICHGDFLKEPTKMRDELGYDLPSMPILIMPVPNRTPMKGSSANISWGESIFAPIRNTVAVRNRVATIVATQANLLSRQPLFNYRDDQGVEIKETVYYAGGVIDLVKGHQEILPSPMKEISPTIIQLLMELNNEVEDGTLPRIDIGKPPASGTALNLVQEASNKIFNPQLLLLNNFYTDMCYLIEEQLLAGKLKSKLQGIYKNKYHEIEVTPVDLKRPHVIEVEHTARTPWTQLDVAQQADMLRGLGLPEGWIWENILKVQDPKGLFDLAALELYDNSPKGLILKAIKVLRKKGRYEEAEQLMNDLYKLEMSEGGQEPPPPKATPITPPEAPIGGEYA